MKKQFQARITAIMIVATLVVTLAFVAGCSNKSSSSSNNASPTPNNAVSAKSGLDAARAAVSTMAPDAKLLVVQTAQPVATTGTPVWAYLFGSPKNGKTYLVYLADGKSMGAQEYGDAGLKASEWPKVPDNVDKWKIDSPDALAKAIAASGAKQGTNPAAYIMGFYTYKPETDTSTSEPWVWGVQFDPGTSGATTKTVDVNVETGAAQIHQAK